MNKPQKPNKPGQAKKAPPYAALPGATASTHALSEEDKALFRDSVQSTTPLKVTKRHQPAPSAHKPRPLTHHTSHAHSAPPTQQRLSPSKLRELLPIHRDEPLSFKHSSISPRALQKLQKGLLPRERELDLHGQTLANGLQRCEDFLADAQAAGYRCVAIIHGKGRLSGTGTVTLKTALNSWLREHPAVLAFCSAPPRAGGTGCVWVLLRAP